MIGNVPVVPTLATVGLVFILPAVRFSLLFPKNATIYKLDFLIFAKMDQYHYINMSGTLWRCYRYKECQNNNLSISYGVSFAGLIGEEKYWHIFNKHQVLKLDNKDMTNGQTEHNKQASDEEDKDYWNVLPGYFAQQKEMTLDNSYKI
ncbi:hypothetical protein ACJX0J_035405, partial [Zea mays]